LTVDKGFDPILKTSQPIPVGMNKTFDNRERPVWGYGSAPVGQAAMQSLQPMHGL
jgi:hypothetical protein